MRRIKDLLGQYEEPGDQVPVLICAIPVSGDFENCLSGRIFYDRFVGIFLA